MIIYPEKWIKVRSIINLSRCWAQSGFITKEQFQGISENNPQEYRTTPFLLSVGIFVLVALAILSLYVLLNTLLDDYGHIYFYIITFVFALSCYWAVGYTIRTKTFFHAGIDDAFQIASSAFLYVGFIKILMDCLKEPPYISYALIALPILLYGVARFASTIFAIMLNACLACTLFLLLDQHLSVPHHWIPFLLMGWSCGLFLIVKFIQNLSKFKPWNNSLKATEAFTIILIYTVFNYFLVRQFHIEYWEVKLADGLLPLANVHYILTAIIPFAYIGWGIYKRNRMLIRIGIISCMFSAFTFQHHFFDEYLMEFLITSGGFFLLATTLTHMYLKKAKHGFITRNIFKHDLDDLNLDGVAIDRIVDVVQQNRT